jgi:hypothetical protein
MTLEDAIALVKENNKRSIRCDCLDCQVQVILVAEVERLRGENTVYKQFSAVHDRAEHDAFMRGREVALEYFPDERNQLLARLESARKHLRHAVEVCSCPDCWRARHGGAPGKLTGKHAVIHVAEEAEKIWDAEAKELAAAIEKAGLAGKTAVEAITILDAEETKLSAKLREYECYQKRDNGHFCPRCGSPSIVCYYSNPAQYECSTCGAKLIDDNREQAESKRPGLYGLPACDKCSHAPHEGICKEGCDHCKPGPPHIYKFRVADAW